MPRLPPWRETWRVLGYTLVIALAFVALGRLQLALFMSTPMQAAVQASGGLDGNRGAKWRAQAEQVAAASQAAIATLPAGHRQAVFELGFALGAASQTEGSHTRSNAQQRATARRLAESQLRTVEAQAARFGLQGMQPLQSASMREFIELDARYEADEGGHAQRVEQRLSPQHRHLFMLGLQVGIEAARIESTGGEYSLPPVSLIARQATLAGIDTPIWLPLTQARAADESPAAVQARYRAAVAALGGELQRQDAR
jgi:hypothetical protein